MQSEKEAVGTLLYQLKLICTSLCTAITESANNHVRSQLTQMLTKSLQNQKLLYDYMNSKGWYKVEAAPPEQFTRTRQSCAQIQQDAHMQ
ncbi:MAG: spore coat protein [Peptococcaceae bacterium]|nr:spore coat protein [Peptococcaceae bacterium]